MVEEETLIWPEVKHKNRIGQLIMCDGTTCGKAEKGALPVPKAEFKRIIKEEGMKPTFKFTVSECMHSTQCTLHVDKNRTDLVGDVSGSRSL